MDQVEYVDTLLRHYRERAAPRNELVALKRRIELANGVHVDVVVEVERGDLDNA